MTVLLNVVQSVAVIASVIVAVVALQRTRSERQADMRRARLERLLDAIVGYVDGVAATREQWGQGALLAAARARLRAATMVAGGAAALPSTDILLRAPVESVADQAEAALLEVTAAITELG